MTHEAAAAVTSLAEFALGVRRSKISSYLLNPQHHQGAAKAAFFVRLGFTSDRPDELISALVDQAWKADRVVARPHPRGYGVEISAVGPLVGIDGRRPIILSAWNWRPGMDVRISPNTNEPVETALFVTAYPA